MTPIEQQVRRAHVRLNSNILLERLALGIIAGAGLWSFAWIVEQSFVFGMPLLPSIAAAAVITLLVTVFGTYRARVDRLAAAVAIDKAAGLKERVSTALAILRSPDPFAQAAVVDAEKTARSVHVPAHVPIRAPRQWPWSAATVLAAGIVFMCMPKLNLLAGQTKPADPQATVEKQAEMKTVEVSLNEQLNKVKKLVDDNPALKDLAKDIQPLDIPKQPEITPEDVRREAVKKIDHVADKLAEKRDAPQLKSLEELKQELAKLEPRQGDDSAAKLSQSLASGDMKAAKQAIEKIKKELQEAAAKGDEASKQKLNEMASKLDELAKQMEKLGDQAKLQKDLENKAGMSKEDAKKLLDELSKMDPKQLEKELQKRMAESGMTKEQVKDLAKKISQDQQAKKQMQDMAKALSKAAQACNKPDNAGQGQNADAQAASQALDEAAGQLSDMEMAEQMMNELEAQMSELKDLREGMCKGNGNKPGNKPSDKIGNQGPDEGQGYGSRIGKEASAHKYKPTKANVKVQGGQIIGQMLIDGPQVKGEATAEVRDAVNSAVRDATDPTELDRIPRQYHDVMKKYFESLAGLANGGGTGKPAADAPAADSPADDDE